MEFKDQRHGAECWTGDRERGKYDNHLTTLPIKTWSLFILGRGRRMEKWGMYDNHFTTVPTNILRYPYNIHCENFYFANDSNFIEDLSSHSWVNSVVQKTPRIFICLMDRSVEHLLHVLPRLLQLCHSWKTWIEPCIQLIPGMLVAGIWQWTSGSNKAKTKRMKPYHL